jgi:hypothetical protein
MTWWYDDINDQQRVNAIASRNATKLRSKQPQDINWDSAIERFRQAITARHEQDRRGTGWHDFEDGRIADPVP